MPGSPCIVAPMNLQPCPYGRGQPRKIALPANKTYPYGYGTYIVRGPPSRFIGRLRSP